MLSKPTRKAVAWAIIATLLLGGVVTGAVTRLQAPPDKEKESAAEPETGVRRAGFALGDKVLRIEVLDDDLLHFELIGGSPAPAVRSPVPTTPMVAKTDYAGPKTYIREQTSVTTAELRVDVDLNTLCVAVRERRRDLALSSFCPTELTKERTVLSIRPERMENIYGLGQQHRVPGNPDGDWANAERKPDVRGNMMAGFDGGAVGNTQFPVLYAVGPESTNYALFMDHIYNINYNFRTDPWTATTTGDAFRFYFMSGPNLPDLRQDFMELVGRPLVPPKQAFGLWVSEYGFDHWAELESKLATLRQKGFPVDGFVLDLQWFGGVQKDSENSSMGRLTWDTKNFPDPAARIAAYRRQGLGLITIEEPYVAKGLPEHADLEAKGFLVRAGCPTCPPVYLDRNPWWGKGSMIDWTNPAAGDYWHDTKRQALIKDGIMGHWADLGEPEMYDPKDWVHGIFPGKHSHDDYHNLYNFKWVESIFRGYQRNQVDRRPLILTRSGAPGLQRFGAAMWSADISSRLTSLAAHYNVQMHMSMSGMDYFGADIGGFHRGSADGEALKELYTQWFAAGALFDVPVRPHTENLCNCKETAPDRVGDPASNLYNIRLRYELIPYLYSLAHRAHRFGEPVYPPLVYYFQDDPNVRKLGAPKLIGRDLLVMPHARSGSTQTKVYLPKGTWVHYYSNQYLRSAGQETNELNLMSGNIYRLPIFVRGGAIIPKLHVDEKTMNALGRRTDGTVRNDLIARVYPDEQATAFTLFEDDGETTAYLSGAVALTELSQQKAGEKVTVKVGAAQGTYRGAPESRNNLIELVVESGGASAVALNGAPLTRHASRAAFEAAPSGWFDTGNRLVLAKSGPLPVSAEKGFEFTLKP